MHAHEAKENSQLLYCNLWQSNLICIQTMLYRTIDTNKQFKKGYRQTLFTRKTKNKHGQIMFTRDIDTGKQCLQWI